MNRPVMKSMVSPMRVASRLIEPMAPEAAGLQTLTQINRTLKTATAQLASFKKPCEKANAAQTKLLATLTLRSDELNVSQLVKFIKTEHPSARMPPVPGQGRFADVGEAAHEAAANISRLISASPSISQQTATALTGLRFHFDKIHDAVTTPSGNRTPANSKTWFNDGNLLSGSSRATQFKREGFYF